MSPYERISEAEAYRLMNEHLIDMSGAADSAVIADLGCGTGAIISLLHERGVGLELWGIDPSSEMIDLAVSRLGDAASWVVGTARDLKTIAKSHPFDLVLMANAIHLVESIGELVSDVKASVRVGGRFAFSTTFFKGADVPSNRPFYWRMLLEARRELRRSGFEMDVSKARQSIAKRPISVANFHDVLTQHGFSVSGREVETVCLSHSLVLDIVSEPIFAAGAIPGVPVEIASATLRKAALNTFEVHPDVRIERKWLRMCAQRMAASQ